jgi:cytochrome c oxidase subunit 1
MFGNLIRGAFKGKKCGSNPWGGASLEWQIPSPPPHHNFVTEPVVDRGPYDFRGVERDECD